jgi:RluA family pseudouridine synthase
MLRKQVGREGLRLAHRLDRETSGLLLIAEDRPSASHFSKAFMQGQVGKQYLAMVQGAPADDAGKIDLPIGEASGSQIYTKRAAGVGQPAVTEWRVERRYADHSLLRLFPQTGRRHQLRVHLAAIGHPILGDLLYGRPESAYLELVRGEGDRRLRDGGPLRQLLHSAGLEFTDPAGRRIVLTSPAPADFVVAGAD